MSMAAKSIINPKDLWSFLKLSNILWDNNNYNIIKYEKFTFSGGEEHIKINPETIENSFVLIECNIRSSNDLMTLLLATDALKRIGVGQIRLCMPYIPYARQDRIMVDGESLSIKVFADIINSQNYNVVYVLDPHSDVSTALIKNIRLINVDSKIDKIIKKHKNPILISPDAGSLKKINKIAQRNNIEDIIICTKERDVTNGKILDTKLWPIKPLNFIDGSSCIIIDDIIDGGKTFIEIAKKLKLMNVKEIVLVVSHGIFSKGFNVFDGLIDKIFCFNLLSIDVNNKVTQQLLSTHNL